MMLPLRVGEVLAGKYRVDAVLGRGAMGAVVAATHLGLDERRALKLMLPTALDQGEAVARFLREARAVSRLKSEHVAKVHDLGTLPDGAPFIVMEHLDGVDLRALVKERRCLSVSEAVLYALHVCEALAEAHASGIVHRDLKPANLFLTFRPDGTACVKVLDFGVSKMACAVDGDVTQTEAVLGSPAYMAPEQMRSSRDVDGRADIWSLGIVLYQLVTGALPFGGDSFPAIVTRVMQGTYPPASTRATHVPSGLDAVIGRCLMLHRDARFATVADLAEALAPFGDAEARASAVRASRVVAALSGAIGRSLSPGVVSEPTPVPSLPVTPAAPPVVADGPRDAGWERTALLASQARSGVASRWLPLLAVLGLAAGAAVAVVALRPLLSLRGAVATRDLVAPSLGENTVEAPIARAGSAPADVESPTPESPSPPTAPPSASPPASATSAAPVPSSLKPAAARIALRPRPSSKPAPPPEVPVSALPPPPERPHAAHRVFGSD